jgi:hypothetical protein
MTAKDLIQQYVTTGTKLPEYQVNKLKSNTLKSYLRQRIIIANRGEVHEWTSFGLAHYEKEVLKRFPDINESYIEGQIKKGQYVINSTEEYLALSEKLKLAYTRTMPLLKDQYEGSNLQVRRNAIDYELKTNPTGINLNWFVDATDKQRVEWFRKIFARNEVDELKELYKLFTPEDEKLFSDALVNAIHHFRTVDSFFFGKLTDEQKWTLLKNRANKAVNQDQQYIKESITNFFFHLSDLVEENEVPREILIKIINWTKQNDFITLPINIFRFLPDDLKKEYLDYVAETGDNIHDSMVRHLNRKYPKYYNKWLTNHMKDNKNDDK